MLVIFIYRFYSVSFFCIFSEKPTKQQVIEALSHERVHSGIWAHLNWLRTKIFFLKEKNLFLCSIIWVRTLILLIAFNLEVAHSHKLKAALLGSLTSQCGGRTADGRDGRRGGPLRTILARWLRPCFLREAERDRACLTGPRSHSSFRSHRTAERFSSGREGREGRVREGFVSRCSQKSASQTISNLCPSLKAITFQDAGVDVLITLLCCPRCLPQNSLWSEGLRSKTLSVFPRYQQAQVFRS